MLSILSFCVISSWSISSCPYLNTDPRKLLSYFFPHKIQRKKFWTNSFVSDEIIHPLTWPPSIWDSVPYILFLCEKICMSNTFTFFCWNVNNRTSYSPTGDTESYSYVTRHITESLAYFECIVWLTFTTLSLKVNFCAFTWETTGFVKKF